MRIAGANPGMENLEFEELSLDPENPGVGRIWLNTTEQKVKFVTHLDELSRSIIRTVATADDVEALNTLLLTHALSHAPNGADAIPTDTAVGLSPSSINKEGVADSLARSDHEHQITGFQPVSSELSQIAALQSDGLLKRDVLGDWNLTALSATDIPNLDWSKITTGKPTTLAGYGITDAVSTNVLSMVAGSITAMSGTNTTIPGDNTVPQATEGALVMQTTVNPASVDSKFVFNFNAMADASVDESGIVLSLFIKIGSGAWTCVNVTTSWIGNAVWPSTSSKPVNLQMLDVNAPNTIEPVSFMLRVGLTSSGSWYLGRGQNFNFGGASYGGFTITEYK
jgi:hypothetical protein